MPANRPNRWPQLFEHHIGEGGQEGPDTVRMLQMTTNSTKMMPEKKSKSEVPTVCCTVPYSARPGRPCRRRWRIPPPWSPRC